MRTELLLVAALMLAGCADPEPKIVIRPAPLPPMVSVPEVDRPALNTVEWKVYSRAELEVLLKENEGDADFYIYSLTPDGYRALTGNMIEINRYAQEQGAVNVFLKSTLIRRSAPQEAPAP